ncbi:PTS sugar transporter subunit IIA [Aquisediminimonas profunda]|uniref:PTS sugar transporter subunit IIA n=1 Tax=Aquisediminimonas profunda TaxID=1550733 RepID=UPI001C62F7C8|nr:PTS sugar transporter subunit IIA [Aquisediminimonas profunda]
MGFLGDMMSAGAVASAVNAPNKKALFQQLGTLAEREYGLDPNEVVERLTERERLGSTGFGKGVAIPHGKIEGLAHIVAAFARLEPPIDFEAIDDLPVDLVFCLLSPPDAGAEHLKALAQVSRWLRDPGFVAKLRGAGSDDAVYALFAGQEERHAA